MFDERVRAALPPVVAPLVRLIVRQGIAANTITIAAFVAATAAAALVGTGHPLAGLVVWLVSRVGDGLDGLVAREEGHSTAFGAYLDITLDMAGYSIMALAFAFVHPDLGLVWPVLLACYALAITTTLALSNAATTAGREVSATNRTFQFTTGLAEGGETSVMYVLWIVFPEAVWWLAWLWVAMVATTVVQRTRLARQSLRP